MMPKIREVIVVEGRYDKNTLRQAVDATIVETNGFGVFNDRDKIALLRRLAEARGLIILTDSDHAGFFIRGRLKGLFPPGTVKHAYIPDVLGRERRKNIPSKEGKLGVEGMRPDVLIEALRRAGATFEENPDAAPQYGGITKLDFFEAGLTGKPGSAERRRALKKHLNLPENLSQNALLDVVNILMTRSEFIELIRSGVFAQ